MPEIEIAIDPAKTPAENAQKYFAKYNKLKRTYEALTELTATTKSELDHLQSVQAFLDMAIDELNKDPYTKVTQVSDFIETKPYGGVEQDDFLNGCLEIETLLSPDELLDLVNGIEFAAGRERIIHWGPRTLDIDILLYDDIVYDDHRLHIPHVEMHKREFVLKPLSAIAGYKRHPLLGSTVSELLEGLETQE